VRERLLMPRPPVFGRARRGQSAVLIALSIFAMLLLLAMATNIGIVVNDKVRMQSTADLSTYAVAYSEAASMNDLVQLNEFIADEVRACRYELEPLFPEEIPCGCQNRSIVAEGIIMECKASIDAAIRAFVARAQYDASVRPALAAGEATARANFSGVHTTFFQDVFGSPTHEGTYTIQATYNLGGVDIGPAIANLRQVADTGLNYEVLMSCGEPPECIPDPVLSNTTYIHTWFYKESKDPDVWVAGRVTGTPEKQFLDTAYGNGSDGGYFGASSTGGSDAITAYAVAKPYDGSIGPTGISGLQANGNGVGPRGVFDPSYVRFPKFSMYDEYRARLAGIHENLQGDTTPEELVEQDGYSLGHRYDMDQFEH
jgi:hypothetical protein